MKRTIVRLAIFLCVGCAGVTLTGYPASAQATADAPDPERDATREKLRALLAVQGPKLNVEFRQSTKQPYNFVGTITTNLKNANSLEIVISVTKRATISVLVYPHYKNSYLNLGRVKDSAAFARKLLRYSNKNFLFWGADDTLDVFCGYTFTLESGFPDNAIGVVLSSIRNTDQYVGEMRPIIDGSSAQ